MDNVKIDWKSIESKIGKAVTNEVRKTAKIDAKVAGQKFVDIMKSVIPNSSGITYDEIQRVLEVPLVFTGASVTGVHTNLEKGIDYGVELHFDFEGDKTMVSLSPNKHVHNLVALFNNGYPTNNVGSTKLKRIIGTWHGHRIEIWEASLEGAHFIGRAIREFELWAASQGITVEARVSPIYYAGAD